MPTQDEIFTKEGDAWFERNDYESTQDYEVLEYFKTRPDYKPKKVLDIGCSDGSKLNKLNNFFNNTNIDFYGIEPSQLAVNKGKERFPGLNLAQGYSHDLKLFPDNHFDVIIFNFVLHWVDRSKLLLTLSEVDRVLKKFGIIVICDFAPAFVYKTKYHHLSNEEVYTYKQPYWNILAASQIYSLIFEKEFEHNKKDKFDNKNLCKIVVLEKRGEDNYLLI